MLFSRQGTLATKLCICLLHFGVGVGDFSLKVLSLSFLFSASSECPTNNVQCCTGLVVAMSEGFSICQ